MIKIEENFSQKATCTNVPSLNTAQVTQVWSQLDTIPIKLEVQQETTQKLELEFLPTLQNSTMHMMHQEEKLVFAEVKEMKVTPRLEPSESSSKFTREIQDFSQDREIILKKIEKEIYHRDNFLENVDFSKNSRKDFVILNDYLKRISN